MGYASDSDYNVCVCKDGYLWNAPGTTPYDKNYDYQCIRDCTAATEPNGDQTHDDADTCHCKQYFTWESIDPTFKNKCVRDCKNVKNSNTDYIHTLADLKQCDCLKNYVWNDGSNTCDNPCGTPKVIHSTGTSCVDPLACTCNNLKYYNWQSKTFKCIQCAAGEHWHPSDETCIVCTLPAHWSPIAS